MDIRKRGASKAIELEEQEIGFGGEKRRKKFRGHNTKWRGGDYHEKYTFSTREKGTVIGLANAGQQSDGKVSLGEGWVGGKDIPRGDEGEKLKKGLSKKGLKKVELHSRG